MMIAGILAALFASVAYGVSSVLQALAARRSHAAAVARGDTGLSTATGGPTLRSTIAAMLSVLFIVGTMLDVLGFVGGAVSARLTPLFLSQTIISANLVITAILGIVVLNIRLHLRDWLAIATVIAALCALGVSAKENPRQTESMLFHWAVLAATVALVVVSVAIVRWLGSRAAIAAGLAAGALFGAVAISVRILDGLDPFSLSSLFTDPALYALAIAGGGGFYLHTVALQLGSVNGATAALVVGETVVPGVIGVLFLGDETVRGLAWLAVVGFVAAVVGAVTVAWSGAVEASAQAEQSEPARA
jgi:drug/metabolite transporter (DMT)-like permease